MSEPLIVAHPSRFAAARVWTWSFSAGFKSLLCLADVVRVLRSNLLSGLLLATTAVALTGVAVWASGGFDMFSPDGGPNGYEPDTRNAVAATPLERMPHLPSPSSPATSPMLTPEYTIRKTIPEVQVQFSVADQKGRLVQDLSASDVRILDDKRPVPELRRFERVDNLPLRVGIVLDVSASMGKVIPQEKTAALTFLKQVLRPESDLAFVLAFGEDVQVEQDATDSRGDLAAAVQRVNAPKNGTELFDALFSACNDHWPVSDNEAVHRVIILVSDGNDTGSLHGLADVVAAAQRNEVQIYPLTIRSRRSNLQGESILRRIADASGGRFYVAGSSKEMSRIFSQIEQDLRTQYYVSFRPNQDGPGFHSLQVEVRGPEKLQIHARQGYYAH